MNHVASLRNDIRMWKYMYILTERYFSQNISKKKVQAIDLRQTVLFKIIIFLLKFIFFIFIIDFLNLLYITLFLLYLVCLYFFLLRFASVYRT